MDQCVYISKIKILKTFLHKQKVWKAGKVGKLYGKQLSMREKSMREKIKYKCKI